MIIDDFEEILKNLKYEFNYLQEVEAALREVLPYNPKKIIGYQPVRMAEILKTISEDKVEDFKKIVILSCIQKNWDDFSLVNYSPSVLSGFDKYFKRVLANCENREGWGDQELEVYWKELGVARRIMFPSGSQMIEQYSGFSIKDGIHLNSLATFSFIKFLILNGGNKGYYQDHTYTPGLGEFTEQGRIETYIRLADMLKINKNIKGYCGISWFFDPQLAEVSPRLAYLHRMPLQYGAELYCLGNDETGNAVSKSNTRMKLYKEGKYTPKSYLLVWSRKNLISWADKYVKNK